MPTGSRASQLDKERAQHHLVHSPVLARLFAWPSVLPDRTSMVCAERDSCTSNTRQSKRTPHASTLQPCQHCRDPTGNEVPHRNKSARMPSMANKLVANFAHRTASKHTSQKGRGVQHTPRRMYDCCPKKQPRTTYNRTKQCRCKTTLTRQCTHTCMQPTLYSRRTMPMCSPSVLLQRSKVLCCIRGISCCSCGQPARPRWCSDVPPCTNMRLTQMETAQT